ncbi:MAG: leucine-rich repeat domain-containing protein, partial [Clostridia bacterium]|nr:leucine-rich repeat domain-containing protein [Clostridia bacterium]
MTSFKLKKRFICFAAVAIVFVVFMSLGVYFAAGNSANIASADATVGGRIEMIDLWERYPIRVIGPLASKNGSGQYVDSAGNRVKDLYGEFTNNIYKIPADQYFNAETYLYTEYNDDNIDIGTGKGRTLYGWKPDIKPVTPGTNETINENGKIISNGIATDDVGIYVRFNNNLFYGTLEKYAIVVPDDVTQIGNGNGAYVTGGKSYYGSSGTTTVTNGLSVDTVAQKFSDFGGFIFNQAAGSFDSNHYFQPRERLAGVYFSERSKLHTIAGGNDTTDSVMNKTSRSGANFSGKSAFAYCDNMRFFILPDGVKTIGQSAFYRCAQLIDVNIPAAVGGTGGSLGKNAFYGCKSLLHITVPSGVAKNAGVFTGCAKLKDVENLSGSFTESDFSAGSLFNYQTVAKKSALYVVGGEPTYNEDGEKVYDAGLDGFIFCQNVKGNTDTFATISGYSRAYTKDKWYALGISGEPDTNGDKVYVFPEEFNDSCERRQGVKYDYIDAGGHKCKNNIGSTDADLVKKYDVAKEFASGTWCVNIVMTKATEVIGDSAFSDSHLRYMETYATYIGASAFAFDTDVGANQSNAQWYYFHQTGAYQTYRLGSSVFATPANSRTRYIIFENYALYNNARTLFGGNGNWLKYQIPVYVNVHSADGEDFTVAESNMAKKFYNDSDFGKVTIQKDAWNKIVVTKRLSGYSYTHQKQYTGFWAPNDAENQTYPSLSNMSSTVWYSDNDCQNKISPTASSNLGIGSIYTTTSQAVNVYTKQIPYPEINAKDWTYTEEMADSTPDGKYSFNELLGLSDDYVVEYVSLTDPWAQVSAIKHGWVDAAGTYALSVKLNESKWGVWKEDTPDVTVYVNQKPIDLGNFANIPKFWARGATVQNALSGDNTVLYEYNEESGTAYYITKRQSLTPIGTETVSNSYAMYSGQSLSIGPENNWNLYKVEGIPASSLSANSSGRYDAAFNFEVNNANYKFVYDGLDDSHNAEEFANNKIVHTSKLERTATISKRWFIVTPFNWLIDINSVGGPESINNQYVLAEKDNGDGTFSAIYEWTYDYDDMTIRVNTPKLANGHEDGILSAVIYRNGTQVTNSITNMANLAYYINDAMPAGEYLIIISAKAAGGYDPFDTPFTITVRPRELDASAIKNYLTGTVDAEKGNVFEKANSNQLFLYDNGTTWQNIYKAINNSLNRNRKSATNNFWAIADLDGYYSNEVLLKY